MRGRQLYTAVLRLMAVGLVAMAAAACGGEAATSDPGAAAPADIRTVTHAMGTTEITGTPQRVVVLDTGELDSVLALGVTPVGAVAADLASGLQSYLGDRTEGVEIVGTIAEPNLESIAALQPDLILSSKTRHEDIYSTLSQIAPTVFAERVGVAWRENFQLFAEALGMSEEAEQILADYRAKAQETGAKFGDPSATTVSMVRFLDGSIRLYGEGSFIGTILSDAGFGRPPIQQVDKTFVEVSREQIGQAEGDLVFYAGYQDAGAENLAAVTAGPLWQNLPAVMEGRAHEVSDDLWYLGIGPIAANMILDELAGYAPAA
ncbi:ABC transporter substrate-binding protein [Pseudonocardia nigra]|uniref:ABC transporter substrate-binding protein n=1 Tax=Pseudonocardia nigra TaxID=1921578 RepID=UPI0027E3B0EA|nr:iron-siderophore ABC transporter substrate-binding protein [Pseudonocardia nigra]